MSYIYPNEAEIYWGIVVVVHLFLSGIVAGSFFTASLSRVFNLTSLRNVFRLSILTSLAFLAANNIPLVLHLGHPEQAQETIITPHLTSAMSAYGFFAPALGLIIVLIILYEFREDLVGLTGLGGLRGFIYRILTLGDSDVSREAIESDKRIVYYSTWVGLGVMILLFSFEGVKLAIKSSPWWNNAIMPLSFIISGVVSGMALIFIIYMLLYPQRGENLKSMGSMGSALIGITVVFIVLEVLKLAQYTYMGGEGSTMVLKLLSEKFFASYYMVQLGLGGLLPIIILGWAKVRNPTSRALYVLASLLILAGVFAMQWNNIVGGQMISKSLKGFASYHMPLFGMEGLLASISFLIIPFLILGFLFVLLPLGDESK